MQASVHRYDETHGSATLVTDDARLIEARAAVVAAAGLRRLRIGQRLVVSVGADGAAEALALPGRPLSPRP